MTPQELAHFLQQLLCAHGVEVRLRDGWLRAGDQLPALRGIWHPGETTNDTGHLDIQVTLPDGRSIVECFAGIGEGADGCHDALKNFIMSSLHVFLAALWEKFDHEQVAVEDWSIGSQNWKAYIGSFVRRFSTDSGISFPGNMFDVIVEAAKREPLGPGPHWIRTFFCNIGDRETVIETLLDNKTWNAGAEAYARLSWPSGKGYYSVRNFLILRESPGGNE